MLSRDFGSIGNGGKIRCVLFDAVGTLIRPEPSVAEAYFSVGQQFGSRRTKEEITARFPVAFAQTESDNRPVGQASAHLDTGDGGLKPTQQSACQDVGNSSRPPTSQEAERNRWQRVVAAVLDDLPHAASEPFEALWHHFSQARHWKLFDDVASVWQGLAESGVVLGIASNFDDRLAGVCRDLQPLDCCEHIFWSAGVGWSKPSPEFFKSIERELKLSPDEILLVGDDYTNDYLGATAAGWQAVLVDREGAHKTQYANVIRTLAELVDS